jgi:3-hydroxyacyl-[acyl-carrier-protein] dehydratase
MASTLIFDLGRHELGRTLYDRASIYSRLPQRHEFEQLDGVVHLDHESGEAIAYRDVRDDEWWCRAHIPGSPVLPGVLMLESAAQLAAFMERYSRPDFEGFVGYGGVDGCKFRQTVKPPCRLWLLCRRKDARSRRIVCYVQGAVEGALVFEATVTGLVVPV